nr:hypothetical protein CFP56_46712 [Quercus suber]
MLLGLPWMATASGRKYALSPHKCHMVFFRFQDTECTTRLGPDIVRPKEAALGSIIHMGMCHEWNSEIFRSYKYGWNHCTWFQEPWRSELGNCTMTLYENPRCDEQGQIWAIDNINSEAHVDKNYDSKCVYPTCEDQNPMRSVRYSCTKPGAVLNLPRFANQYNIARAEHVAFLSVNNDARTAVQSSNVHAISTREIQQQHRHAIWELSRTAKRHERDTMPYPFAKMHRPGIEPGASRHQECNLCTQLNTAVPGPYKTDLIHVGSACTSIEFNV